MSSLDAYCYRAVILVVEYCNIEYSEITFPLLMQILSILQDQLRSDSILGDSDGEVKSIREGDTTVQMTTLIDTLNAYAKSTTLISNYYVVLNAYRKVKK